MGGLLLRIKGEMIMDTPLIIRMDEAKKSIVKFINDIMQQNQLPCYLREPTISEIYSEIRNGANNELEMAKQQMEQEVAKQQKKDEVVE